MREIKFRGKRIDNGNWVYGFLFKTPLTAENFEADSFQSGKSRVCISDNNGVVFEIDPNTIGQYINKLDKHTKQIYDGDVIRFEDIRYDNKVMQRVVEYVEGCYFPLQAYCNNILIIGNIFDNPELK